ncbi:flagellar biosynthetic protein FliQ [Aliifodinibius sp. S!AR15-10]|uniref:flagellar biosynthetic protein FliQ n=1 Tax=Aliifodinibius sp. S!AR15-10 TaxID=2950437 RepID=UPI00285E592D|nr:flagellar biosynthetic protein FliQ [Aliifodinibius sp. S!AR15-10]MDR8394241.1 flagellar biosynthetic protein FliQ [Aliifodinibius sp. S!AR15-10]
MNIETALYWLQEMLTAIIALAGPPLTGALVIGLSVAIFQAATSIQEMTLSYIPKMVVVVVILFFSFGFMLQYAIGFMERVFEIIPEVIN